MQCQDVACGCERASLPVCVCVTVKGQRAGGGDCSMCSYDLSHCESSPPKFSVPNFFRASSFPMVCAGGRAESGTPRLLQPSAADKWESNLHAAVKRLLRAACERVEIVRLNPNR